MILSLLKTASELEQYAREGESSCANLIQLLKPTYDTYKLKPPSLPRPVPLTAYPLDFTPPESSCPPWGQKVMIALNKISANCNSNLQSGILRHDSEMGQFVHEKEPSYPAEHNQDILSIIDTTTPPTKNRFPIQTNESVSIKKNNQFQCSQDAVALVVSAFSKQDDEEQSARLGRKNVQVMDRLAKMQAHKRASTLIIRDSYGSNNLSTNAADEFHANANEAIVHTRATSNNTSLINNKLSCKSNDLDGDFFASSTESLGPKDQVPLLRCGILLGGSTGVCYVTAHQILFVTQLIPILGGSQYHLFPITEVELILKNPSKSSLLSMPASIAVHRNAINYGNRDKYNPLNQQQQHHKKQSKKVLFTFIPTINASRFQKFVNIVQTIKTEDPETLKLSERGGLLYMFDDTFSELKSAKLPT